MSRKHFESLAAAVKNSSEHLKGANHPEVVAATLSLVAHQVADACQQHNSNFDRSRFLAACGINS